MPRLRPFTPIFTKDLKYGTQARPGVLVGSLNGIASPGAINVVVTLPTPDVSDGTWTGDIFTLGHASVSGGASQNTIQITGLSIPQDALVLLMTSCGTNTAGATTATCTNLTLTDAGYGPHDNNAPNPDRRTTIFRGVAGSGAGSTITVTFPAATTERMACACYITGAPTTNNGADAIAGSVHDNNNSFNITQTPGSGHAQVGFAWISASGSTDPITGTSATQVLDFSDGTNYTLAIVYWPNGQTNPVMSIPTLGGGQGISVELTGLLN
jgi:hypothetical protein